MRITSAALMALLWLAAAKPAESSSRTVECGWHDGVEIASIAARLAGYEEYSKKGWEAWTDASDAWFSNYDKHDAVKLLQALRAEREIYFDAVINLGLWLTADGRALRIPAQGLPPGFDTRWDDSSLRKAALGLLALARDSDYTSFKSSTAHLRDHVIEGFCSFVQQNALDLERYSRWFGEPVTEQRFFAVPGPLQGSYNYGPRIEVEGVSEHYALIGLPARTTEGQFNWKSHTSNLLAHEFAHGFANPWVDRHAAALETVAAQQLFEHARATLVSRHYTTSRVLLYETVVRAAGQAEKGTPHGDISVLALAIGDANQGFPWSKDLAERFRRLSGDSELEPGVVVSVMSEWSRDKHRVIEGIAASELINDYWARRAGNFDVVKLDPENGACGLSAGDRTLSVRVNLPANPNVLAFLHRPDAGGIFPPTNARVSPRWWWEEGNRVLRMPVSLMAETDYALLLGDGLRPGIESHEGLGARPQVWRFTTRACQTAQEGAGGA